MRSIESLSPRACHPWAATVILVCGLLRWWFVASGQLDLVQDEAQYWTWTRVFQWSYYSKGPLIAWIISGGTALFGHSELGVRFGSIVGSVLIQTLGYLGVAKLWQRPRAGLWMLLVANTMPIVLASGILMTTDNPLLVCWLAGMFALYRGSVPRPSLGDAPLPRWPWVVLAAVLALGTLAKYMMLSFVPLAGLYALLLSRFRGLPEGFWKRLGISVAVGVVVGMLPILIWNFQNDFVGFSHVTHLVGVAGAKAEQVLRFDRFGDYLGSQVALVTPWWLALMLWGGWQAVRAAAGRTAAIQTLGAPREAALMLAVFFWPVWGGLILWSLHTKVLGNWSAVSYAAGLMLAGFAARSFWQRASRGWRRALVGCAVAGFLVLHLAAMLPLPGVVNPTARLKGWHDLGREVAELRDQLPDPQKVFVLSSLYDLAAELAFYGPQDAPVYNAWIDRRMNQYDLWPGPQELVGWDAIYVRKEFKEHPEKEVRAMFAECGPPIQYQTTHNGQPGRRFTLFQCRGYNGQWPRPDSADF